jgi:hypothetical protein
MKFNRLSVPLLAADNSVAFAGSLLTTDGASDTGLWMGLQDKVRLVAREGAPTPAGAGTAFGDFMALPPRLAVNSHGQVVFQAALTGAGVEPATSQAVFGTDRAGQLVTLARYGQAFDTGGGVMKSGGTFSALFGSNSDDGLPSAFNDAGEFVFTVTFDSGTAAESSLLVRAAIPLPGDATRDGVVDFADFRRLYNNLDQPGDQTRGDFNYDGRVTFGDYQLLERWFGTTLADPAPAAAALPAEMRAFAQSVPEPGVLTPLLAVMAVTRRSRRRR